MLWIASASASTADAAPIVHVPPGLTGKVPLVVLVHGCGRTPAEQQVASRYDPVADREGFVVLYPDNDHPGGCWAWYDPGSWRRGGRDVEMIVRQTRDVMAAHPIDPERVYVVGMSSGALMTSDLAATYPDLFAAFGLMAGGPFEGVACLGASVGNHPPTLAQSAFAAEGAHARMLPFIVLHGDADRTISPECGRIAVEQWLRTDNLVLSGGQEAPLPLAPARTEAKAGGLPYEIAHFDDPRGCEVAQRWTIHGMDHAWSGGPDDPRGPDAAEATWSFLSRHRLSQTEVPCAEVKSSVARSRARKCAKRAYRRRHPRRCRVRTRP